MVTSTLKLAESWSASDGVSAKALWRTSDDLTFETGYFRLPAYDSICVSSQVGCNVGCRFCVTGLKRVARNLDPQEIVDQVLADPFNLFSSGRRLKISYQGMGEPFHNLSNVIASLTSLRKEVPRSELGVSTVGFRRHLMELAESVPGVKLQISLHSVDSSTRRALIPKSDRGHIPELLEAASAYADANSRPVVLNYMLLRGVNDSFHDGHSLGSLAREQFEFKISNYNWSPLLPYLPSPPSSTDEFILGFLSTGASYYGFESLGGDIACGCGHLRSRGISDVGES